MIDFDVINIDRLNKPEHYKAKILSLIQKGNLGLLLGAGASSGFNLPMWSELVESCIQESPNKIKSELSDEKKIQTLIKQLNNKEKYIEIVRNQLYKDKEFNFNLIQSPLLIALMSLIRGSRSNSINQIISLNFDSLLEWYLGVIGIKATAIFKDAQLRDNADVEIIHPHGYLPHRAFSDETSEEIRFSESELSNIYGDDKSYMRQMFLEFFTTRVFLSIGVSPYSFLSYIKRYLDLVSSRLSERLDPFGFAIFPKGDLQKLVDGDEEFSTVQELIEAFNDKGIVPIEIEKEKIPEFLFEIAQGVAKVVTPYSL